MFLTNIRHLEYTPCTGMNTILGGNGAGKSKLLLELSPLPVNKKYYTDGYKCITITHNKKEYILTSGNSIQSFKEDDIELNSNGLITTQNDLVKEYFNLDTDIRDLNLGIKKFTNLTIGERKKWFTRVSTSDYSFALKLYNNLKINLRDLRGSIKLLNNKNITIDEDTLASMYKDKEKLTKHKETLLKVSLGEVYNIVDPDFTYLDKVEVFLHNLKPSLEDDVPLNYLESHLATKEKDIIKLNSDIKSILDEEDDGFLIKEVETLRKNIIDKKNNTHNVIEEDVFDLMFNTRTKLLVLLESVKYTKKEYDDLSLEYNKINIDLTNLNSKLELLEENKAHLEEHKDKEDVECPECKHKWRVGFNIKEYDILINNIKELNNKLDTVLLKHKEISIELEAATLSINAIGDTHKLIKSIPSVYVGDVLYSVIGDKSYLNTINSLYADLDKSKEIYRLNIKLKNLEDKLKTQNIINNTHKENNALNKAKLESELSYLYTEVSNIKNNIKERKLLDKQKDSIKEYIVKLEKDIEMFDSNTTKGIESSIRGLAIETLDIINTKLDTITNNINRVENDKAIISFTNKKLEEETRKAEVLEELIEELSPDNGIIAESLSNFLYIFVEDMNNIINNIWQYELKILPCSVEDGDLDYIFKVKIPNSIVGDIRDLSTGQKEIVDFAFKLTVLSYLSLLDLPIMLDEVFTNLEPKHKELSFKYLDTLLDTRTIEQAFMVSHRDESYTSIDDSTIFIGEGVKSKRLKIKNG